MEMFFLYGAAAGAGCFRPDAAAADLLAVADPWRGGGAGLSGGGDPPGRSRCGKPFVGGFGGPTGAAGSGTGIPGGPVS